MAIKKLNFEKVTLDRASPDKVKIGSIDYPKIKYEKAEPKKITEI